MPTKLLSTPRVAFCLAALIIAGTRTGDVRALETCACTAAGPLGTCQIKAGNYSDQFPGSAVIVVDGTTKYLFVADLYSGFTYRYDATRFQTAAPVSFPSPAGSLLTTGIAHVVPEIGLIDSFLAFAVDDTIWRTDLDGGNPIRLGDVELAEIAEILRVDLGESIQPGALGGITWHPTRKTLWGVDIVNDAYFEFNLQGRLVREDGKARYFLNPRRLPVTGGAYGNSIAYVATASGEYFDIPVGSLADGRPSEVFRVHAVDAVEPATERIGDATGMSYELGAAIGSPPFVTGIAFWKDSCAEGQHTEILLELPAEISSTGPKPRIIEVSADEPTAAGIADFACASPDGDSVRLTWRKTLPYTTLSIARRSLTSGAPAQTVFEHADFATDPEEHTDSNVPDGSWEYVATVTAAEPTPVARCRIAVSNGALLGAVTFEPSGVEAPVPYAVTVIGKQQVAVADLETGTTQIYDLDLTPVDRFDKPFTEGYTVGLAYATVGEGDQLQERLYFLQDIGGQHWLQPTDLQGEPLDLPVFVKPPDNLNAAGIQLGDIVWDPLRDAFWTVDLKSQSIFAFDATGAVLEAFRTRQMKTPDPGGFLGGGIALPATSETRVSFDIPAGATAAGFVNQIQRGEYDPAAPATAATAIFKIDVTASIGAAAVAGVDIVETDAGTFEYVTAMDTGAVYKIGITGSPTAQKTYRRGDINNDTTVNISDPSFLLEHLFRQGPEPPCMVTADVDDSDTVSITDAIYAFSYLFKGGPAPPAPFAACGVDATTTLTCNEATCSD